MSAGGFDIEVNRYEYGIFKWTESKSAARPATLLFFVYLLVKLDFYFSATKTQPPNQQTIIISIEFDLILLEIIRINLEYGHLLGLHGHFSSVYN